MKKCFAFFFLKETQQKMFCFFENDITNIINNHIKLIIRQNSFYNLLYLILTNEKQMKLRLIFFFVI